MYQQANNFWLRKLAHGREVYLIPTGEIATVVFITELLTQLRTRGVDLDKVSHCRARQDGKLLDKTNNTKYAAQQIADIIHSWVPARTTIQRALMNNSTSPSPPPTPAFDPSSLLVCLSTVDPWLAQHMPTTLASRAFAKWLKELPLSEPKRKVLTDNIAKTETWCSNQPSDAIETIERVAVMMGLPVSLLGKNYDMLNLLYEP